MNAIQIGDSVNVWLSENNVFFNYVILHLPLFSGDPFVFYSKLEKSTIMINQYYYIELNRGRK